MGHNVKLIIIVTVHQSMSHKFKSSVLGRKFSFACEVLNQLSYNLMKHNLENI